MISMCDKACQATRSVVKTGNPMLLKLCESVLEWWETARWEGVPGSVPHTLEPKHVTLARAYMVEVTGEA